MLRLGTQTGSMTNHLMSRSKMPDPVVGMGVTFLSWSDRSPGTIIEVVNVNTIVVQMDRAERTDSNGLSEHQTYEFIPNTEGYKETYTLRKNGAWVRRGDSMKGATLLIGQRDKYRDPSF